MPQPIDQPETAHAFADRTGRFPFDQLLRDNGFRLVSRPKQGQSQWTRDGRLYTFKRALKQLPESLVREARRSEERYLDGVFG